MPHKTRFGSLENYEKGGVEVINDDPRNYVFSNIFEVASKSEPYEKVAVGKNLEVRPRGDSRRGHVALVHRLARRIRDVMDGEVEIRLVKLDKALVPRATKAPRCSKARPTGAGWDTIVARRGHMALLPKGAAYQFHAEQAGRDPDPDNSGRRYRRALDRHLPEVSARSKGAS